MSQLIAKLEKKKLEAVATERFEYAKKIKSAIGEKKTNYLHFLTFLPNSKSDILNVDTNNFFERRSQSVVSEDDNYVSYTPTIFFSGELVEAGQMLASLQMEKRFPK